MEKTIEEIKIALENIKAKKGNSPIKSSSPVSDEDIDAEIEKLKDDPDVQLARIEVRYRYRKRKYLYNLRQLQRRGEELREAGITGDDLFRMTQGIDETAREENEGD